MKEELKKLPWLCHALADVSDIMGEMLSCAREYGELAPVIDDALKACGKMLRPAVLILCAGEEALQSQAREEILYSAAAVEVTHTASLIHDDIIDDSPCRRGRPSLQSAYGKSAAVYAGDYLLVSAMQHLIEKGFGQSGAMLAESIRKMCNGELVQLNSKNNCDTDESRYFEAIEGKTAALFSTACRLGAVLSGSDEETIKCLSEYGRCLGLMFQLRDDILDWVADEREIGKPVNGDFFSGNYTLPALFSFKNRQYRDRLIMMSYEKYSEETAVQARRIVTACGGIEYTRDKLLELEVQAEKHISKYKNAQCAALLRRLVQETVKY